MRMRECDRCGKKIRYGSLCERCNGYLEGLMQNRKREADIRAEVIDECIQAISVVNTMRQEEGYKHYVNDCIDALEQLKEQGE